MRMWTAVVVWALGTGALAAAGEAVPLYTNDDLDRMFGPPLPPVTDRVDKSGPADWSWVEEFLDRQYARIDADRQYDLSRRATAASVETIPDTTANGWTYAYPVSWWWNGGRRFGPTSRPVIRSMHVEAVHASAGHSRATCGPPRSASRPTSTLR